MKKLKLFKKTQYKEKISTNIIPDKNIETSLINEKIKQTEIKENNTCSNEEVLENKCSNVTIEIEQVKELFFIKYKI